jgi:hypothetical protein
MRGSVPLWPPHGFSEALDDHNRSLIEGLAIVGIEVTLEDPERKDPSIRTLRPGRPYDLDGARSALGQDLTNALVPRLRARCREWPTYGALKVTMSRLKKRSVADGGASSGAAAATRAACAGGEASPSAARAITGDTMVSTIRNFKACHICRRPLSFVLASRRGPSMADTMAESHRMVGSDGARDGPGRSI